MVSAGVRCSAAQSLPQFTHEIVCGSICGQLQNGILGDDPLQRTIRADVGVFKGTVDRPSFEKPAHAAQAEETDGQQKNEQEP